MLYYSISRICRPYEWHRNLYYVIGFGLPIVIVRLVSLSPITGTSVKTVILSTILIVSEYYELSVYVRIFHDEEAGTCRTLCWVQYQYLWLVMLIPIGLVAGSNFCVAIRAVVAAYTSASFRFC